MASALFTSSAGYIGTQATKRMEVLSQDNGWPLAKRQKTGETTFAAVGNSALASESSPMNPTPVNQPNGAVMLDAALEDRQEQQRILQAQLSQLNADDLQLAQAITDRFTTLAMQMSQTIQESCRIRCLAREEALAQVLAQTVDVVSVRNKYVDLFNKTHDLFGLVSFPFPADVLPSKPITTKPMPAGVPEV